jgi:multidrug efflux pump subunit AcrB
MFNLFYRNVQLTVLTLCLIVVWGFSSFNILPRLEDPVITQRNAVITTLFPGAEAERVETLITERIEEQLFEVSEVNNFSSTSRPSVSIVEVRLKDTVNNVDEVWSEIRDRVEDAAAELPEGAFNPEFNELDTTANALILGLSWDLDTPVNYAVIGRLANQLEDDLLALKTTKKVETFGVPEEEILIEVDAAELTSLGLTSRDLSDQILSSDAKISAGQLRGDTNEFLFEVSGALDTLERIRRIPIQLNQNGQFSVLADIAEVSRGVASPPEQLAIVGGQPGVVVAARVETQQRIDLWMRRVNRVVEKFQQNLPRGVKLQVLLDQSQYVETRLNSVVANLIIAALSVLGLTFLIMGWRSALVIGAALPLSVLMVFGGMNIFDIPLHQISVTGIIISLGLLVDNAIVVVDSVQSKIEKGVPSHSAVAQTVQGLFIPLFASTLTTILAFYPIASAPGSTGEFTGTIGINVIMALVSSLFLALTIIPALAGWSHASRSQVHGDLPLASETSSMLGLGFLYSKLIKSYRWTIQKNLAQPTLGIALSLILPIIGFIVFPTLEQQFFPPTDRDQFYIELTLPSQTPISHTREIALQVRSKILEHPDVEEAYWFIGESAPAFYYNVIEGESNVPHYAEALIQLKPHAYSRAVIQALQNSLDHAFPEAQILVRQLEQGPPYDAPVELRLYASNLAQLQQLSEQFRSELVQVEDIIHTRSTLGESEPKLSIGLNENQAQLVGLSKVEIAQQLDNALEGVVGGSILEFTRELPVRVRIDNANRGNLEHVSSLDLLPQVNNPNASLQTIPLPTVGHFDLVPSLSVIEHRNGKRVNDVLGFTTAGVLPSQVLADFKRKLSDTQLELPPGFSLEFGGEAEAQDTAISNLISTIGVLVLIMITTLVLSFQSFWLASIIFVVAGCSCGLSFGALKIFGYPFGFTSILGMLGLMGLGINDSIVVLTALKNQPRACHGDLKAINQVTFESSRHVITTTLTTITGLTPLFFDQTGFWPPLAVSISGGLLGATILSLYFVPSTFVLLVKNGLYKK